MSLNLPPEKEPALYILMRSDLESLNPGKMVAQGAHAANQSVAMLSKDHSIYPLYEQWRSSTPCGFGVTLCLDVTGDQLPPVVEAAYRAGFAAGVTHDPSYPLQDGQVLHTLPLDTCGYVFGHKPDLYILLGQFDLLK